MKRDRNYGTAEKFGILEQCKALEADLRLNPHVSHVDFDLDGYYDGFKQIILLLHYNIPVESALYYKIRRKMLNDCLSVMRDKYGLFRTEDTIEDYGTCFYIVTKYSQFNDKWNRKVVQ